MCLQQQQLETVASNRLLFETKQKRRFFSAIENIQHFINWMFAFHKAAKHQHSSLKPKYNKNNENLKKKINFSSLFSTVYVNPFIPLSNCVFKNANKKDEIFYYNRKQKQNAWVHNYIAPRLIFWFTYEILFSMKLKKIAFISFEIDQNWSDDECLNDPFSFLFPARFAFV